MTAAPVAWLGIDALSRQPRNQYKQALLQTVPAHRGLDITIGGLT